MDAAQAITMEAAAKIEELIRERDSARQHWKLFEKELTRVQEQSAERLEALKWLVGVINKAGLSNLANGAQLGQISWLVKAQDAFDHAGRLIAVAEDEKREEAAAHGQFGVGA